MQVYTEDRSFFFSLSLSLSPSSSGWYNSHRVAEKLEELQIQARETRKLQAGQLLSPPSRAELGRSIWEACQSKTEGINETTAQHVPTPLLTQQEQDAWKANYRANSGSKENLWVTASS